jgi:prepilin-type N-terminal cleavage/methylation domain-containing protein/prepilin-type processing-associated H-X9-DG protein
MPIMNRRGFSLIELLVVIAIIAVLAAILFPVFTSAREKGRQVVCASNIRQLGLAAVQYTQDFDGRYPGVTGGKPGIGVYGGWIYYVGPWPNCIFTPDKGALYPYVKSDQVYYCPDDSMGEESGDSYAINGGLYVNAPSSGTAGFTMGPRVNQVRFPSQTLLFVEEATTGNDQSTGSTNDGNWWPGTTGNLVGQTDGVNNCSGPASAATADCLSTRHNGGSEMCFCDGHVHYYTPTQVYLGSTGIPRAGL